MMASVGDLNTIWRNLREIDLQAFRNQALKEVRLVLVGAPGSGRQALADGLRRDPSRPEMQTQTPVLILDLEEARQPFPADLILVVVDATRLEFQAELTLASTWNNQGKNVIFFANHSEIQPAAGTQLKWPKSRLVAGPLEDEQFLQHRLAPLVMEILPDNLLALGRQFPLFRVAIANHLINEACFSNATYALGTGLAEVVPVLNLPLTLTDMIVLTKSQAFLAYKLGLAFGFSLEWRDYLAEFGSVIGSGFLWRQLARSLVGLIPVLGIVPKIAVAYSGTYVVGHTILQWYLTGRHLSPRQMRALTVHAFQRGQEAARQLAAKVRKPRQESGRLKGKKARRAVVSGGEQAAQLEAGGSEAAEGSITTVKPKRKLFGSRKKEPSGKITSRAELGAKGRKRPSRKDKKAQRAEVKLCLQCGKPNAADANFCQYCAAPFEAEAESQSTRD